MNKTQLSQPFFMYQMAQSLVVLVAFCCTLSNMFWEVENPSQVQIQPYERSMPTSLNLLALLELMQNFFFFPESQTAESDSTRAYEVPYISSCKSDFQTICLQPILVPVFFISHPRSRTLLLPLN